MESCALVLPKERCSSPRGAARKPPLTKTRQKRAPVLNNLQVLSRRTPKGNRLILTCEHGGNRIPSAYADLFSKAGAELTSHRGYDPGALDLAKALGSALRAPLVFSTVSRLLVELNRTARHPALFSEFTRGLTPAEKDKLLRRYYWPHWRMIESLIAESLAQGMRVTHIGVHTFTPVLHGVERTADIGLLYDPARPREKAFCVRWQEALRKSGLELRVRRNDPYRGAADGLTTHLRRHFGSSRYIGVELEVNNRFAVDDAPTWRAIQRAITQSLDSLL
ncbi:MAG: N-formylglutamate amidohydrolase [Candidatus Hydrogenedentes bacterium]|nr:N-formylglutamate amidohydrolase [Candidatus Hydrogenedentota bacterium]